MKPGPKGTHKPRNQRPNKNRSKGQRASVNQHAHAYSKWSFDKMGNRTPLVAAFDFPSKKAKSYA